MSRLLETYKNSIVSDFMTEMKLKNLHEVPKLTKIVLNMGIGEGKEDSKIIDKAVEDLTLIAGQRAIKTKAKKAISGFKIREGMALGAKVTLRNKIMYEFLDRLINIAMPRIRDFRGLKQKGFDGKGNFSFGIKEHVIFPEINFDKVDRATGLDITICTTTDDDNLAFQLLKKFNMPFNDSKDN